MNAKQRKRSRFTVERRGGRGFGRLHECSDAPPSFDFVKSRWGAGDYRIRFFDTDANKWRVVDSFSVAEDGGVTEMEPQSEENALREVVELLRAQTRQISALQQRLQRVEQERRHPIEEVLQSLAYMDELRSRLTPRSANPPGDEGVLGNLAKGFGAMMMQAAHSGAPADNPAWPPFAAMDVGRPAPPPAAHRHQPHGYHHHRHHAPPPQPAAPTPPPLRQPSLPGMTPDIERELAEYSQMMNIPWEVGIAQARAQGWEANQLLAFARGHVERMTTPKQPEAPHGPPSF